MQKSITSWFSLMTVGLMATLIIPGASAIEPLKRPETSLLGVPLMSSFKVILHKFGSPTTIQVGTPVVVEPTTSSSAQGGRPGMPGAPGMPGMPGAPSAPGTPAMPGAPSAPGPGGPSGGYGGPPPGYGGPGGPGMSRGKGGMMPGGQGMGGGNSQYSNPTGTGTPGQSGYESQFTTWWYNYPSKGVHYSFLLNGRGQVIQIQAYGFAPPKNLVAPHTAQGITLGSALQEVLHRYGWTNDGTSTSGLVTLQYGEDDRIAFQIQFNHVIGIVLGIAHKPGTVEING